VEVKRAPGEVFVDEDGDTIMTEDGLPWGEQRRALASGDMWDCLEAGRPETGKGIVAVDEATARAWVLRTSAVVAEYVQVNQHEPPPLTPTDTLLRRALTVILDDARVPAQDNSGKALAPLERVELLIQQRDHAVTMNEATRQAHVKTVARANELAEWRARVLSTF